MAIATRDRRALLLGAVAIAAGFVVRYAAVPWATRSLGLRERLESERELLARDMGLLAYQTQITHYREALQSSRAGLLGRLFSGATDELVLAGIQRTVQQYSIDADVPILQVRPDGHVEYANNLARWRVVAEGESDIEAILAFTRSLETSDRLLHVTRVLVGQRDMLTDPDAILVGKLHFSVSVEGWFLPTSSGPVPRAGRQARAQEPPADGYLPPGYLPGGTR